MTSLRWPPSPSPSGGRALLGLRPGVRVLDVGCGSGVDTLALAAAVGPGGAVGVDASVEAIRAAREAAQGHPRASFVVGDACALPFGDRSFDACFCDRTLQHLEDPGRAMAEMARVLAPGGVVLVGDTVMSLEHADDVPIAPLQAVVRALHARGDDEAWVGFMLPLLIRRAGLTLDRIDHASARLTDAPGIARAYGLERLGQGMIASGALDPAALERAEGVLARHAGDSLHVRLESYAFLARMVTEAS